MTEINFGDLILSKRVVQAIKEMGFEEPSPIQAQAIPCLLEGHDLIGQAQTGTGKTAAFGIPIVEKVNTKVPYVQALILTPTRELALQVAEEISKIGKHKQVRTLPIYGGQSIDRQIRALQHRIHVAIGTPGRIIDHLKRGTLKLNNLNYIVLDEADEMLDMGFIDDITYIIEQLPKERQTLLFSATMPGTILDLARKYMKNPKSITVSKDELTVPLIDQVFYEVGSIEKLDAFCRILDISDYEQAIVFCRTKRGADELTASLQARGYEAEGLHGDLSQSQRDRVMKKFRDNEVEILVATDVAARGIDVDKVTHVFNYDIPQDPESYVHRIGRTGRAGKSGIAITLITPREFRQLKLIEKIAKTLIRKVKLPSLLDVVERQQELFRQRLVAVLEEGAYTEYKQLLGELTVNYDPLDLAAATVKLFFKEKQKETVTISENKNHDFTNTGAAPGMVRLFMNVGKEQNIRPQDIVKTIAEQAGIPGNTIGVINIYDKFTFVEVPVNKAELVLDVMHHNLLNGIRVNVHPAKARAKSY